MKLTYKLQGTLFTYSRHTADIVGAVAHNCFKVYDFTGVYTVFFFDFINAVNFHLRHSATVNRHYNPSFIADQLKIVAVTRHNITFISVLLTVSRKRADNIISLKPLTRKHLDVHSAKYLFKRVKLHGKLIRHSVPLSLIFRIHHMPKGFCTHIKRNRNHIGFGHLEIFKIQLQKSKYRVCRHSVFCSKVFYRVKRAVNY